MKELGEYTNLTELTQDLGIFLPAARRDKWRLLYPNAGEILGFPHFGTVLVLCTDGTEAYFHAGRDTIFHSHLSSFTGPIAKEYVHEEDWDFEQRKHRVNVFRRADQSLVIIPTDKAKASYWRKHESYDSGELEFWNRISHHIWYSKDCKRVKLPDGKLTDSSSHPIWITAEGVEWLNNFDATVSSIKEATKRPRKESKQTKMRKQFLNDL